MVLAFAWCKVFHKWCSAASTWCRILHQSHNKASSDIMVQILVKCCAKAASSDKVLMKLTKAGQQFFQRQNGARLSKTRTRTAQQPATKRRRAWQQSRHTASAQLVPRTTLGSLVPFNRDTPVLPLLRGRYTLCVCVDHIAWLRGLLVCLGAVAAPCSVLRGCVFYIVAAVRFALSSCSNGCELAVCFASLLLGFCCFASALPRLRRVLHFPQLLHCCCVLCFLVRG